MGYALGSLGADDDVRAFFYKTADLLRSYLFRRYNVALTVTALPRNVYCRPAERAEPKSVRLSTGKSRCSSVRMSSCPTAPDAPTIAMFIFRNIVFADVCYPLIMSDMCGLPEGAPLIRCKITKKS